MHTLCEINLEQATAPEIVKFDVRNTARAVIFDSEKNIALLKVANGNFYKLPGGGIEEGEDVILALKRECKEEAGVDISQPIELGLIIEIKKTQNKVQNSYCFITSLVGEKHKTNFTNAEQGAGYSILWVPIAKALENITEEGYSNLAGEYVYQRELTILSAALEYEGKI